MSMSQTAAQSRISARKPFKASGLSGEWEPVTALGGLPYTFTTSGDNGHAVYVVRSFGQPVAVADRTGMLLLGRLYRHPAAYKHTAHVLAGAHHKV